MEHQDLLGESLLQWVRSFSEAADTIEWKDLNDGRALWLILQDIDNSFFNGTLPEPNISSSDDWTRRWQNLKHVEKQVGLYYRDVCNGQEVSERNGPDLKAIAAEASAHNLDKLIMLIIRAGMESPQANERMAKRLMGLGRERAMVIAGQLRAMEESEYVEDSEPVSRDESAHDSEAESVQKKQNGLKSSGGLYSDPLLEKEEELLLAHATIGKLEASHAAAQTQLQDLRQQQSKLQEAFDTYRNEIDAKGRKGGNDDLVKKLQRQTESDKAYIDDLENQMQTTRNTVEKYERQAQKFKDEADANQTLRDELQMLRSENEDLTQKIKANENLKKKIQALQEQERLNVKLKEELKEKDDRLEELDRLKHLQANLEKEIIEKRGLIRNQEYQITELTTTRKHAEYDSRLLAQKLEAARERHGHDHEAIEELRQRLQELDAGDAGVAAKEDMGQEINNSETTVKTHARAPTLNESKHLAEKVALLEQQLEAADARLKQAAERGEAHGTASRDLDASTQDRLRLQQLAQEQEVKIVELRKQLDAAAKMPPPAAAPELASLQRENKLMTSAWYDLSSRLQSNGVSLARRRQEPKSWIGKQRAMVGPGP